MTNGRIVISHQLSHCDHFALDKKLIIYKTTTAAAREYGKADRNIRRSSANHEMGIPLVLEDSEVLPPMHGLRMRPLPQDPLLGVGGFLLFSPKSRAPSPQAPDAQQVSGRVNEVKVILWVRENPSNVLKLYVQPASLWTGLRHPGKKPCYSIHLPGQDPHEA